jgi:hypothetical protein
MRSGRLGDVKGMLGGGCLTRSLATARNVGETRTGMCTTVNAISGDECSAAFDGASWLLSGTEFLQHSSESAVGAHLPLRQQSAAWRLGVPAATQSKGLTSRITTIRLIAM